MKLTNKRLMELDALYIQFCNENGIVMDSDQDRANYAARGHLYSDPGSDLNDQAAP